MSDRDSLLEMGFAEAAVNRALKATSNSGLQSALDWLDAHADDDHEAEQDTTEATGSEDAGELKEDEEGTAQSLVCNDCGKRFRDASFAERHATISGHVNFAESAEAIKPLTEEERAEKLQELKQRMAEKRELLKQQEKEEQKERERIRRLAGQEMNEAKERLKEQEILKAVEAKKREKLEDKRARDAIIQQIEEDKKERAARRAQASASRPRPTTTNHTETRLQLRMPSGPPVINTFAVDAPLDEVMVFVREKLGNSAANVTLSTVFPRRVLTSNEKSKTLKELDLVPSSVLVVAVLP
ncbi:ubiquitin-related domain-containing protein [Syncephalis fuscata]|nr:ubiquitin-related domain-containing protein [Syncephalis fuscata]